MFELSTYLATDSYHTPSTYWSYEATTPFSFWNRGAAKPCVHSMQYDEQA